MSLIFASAERPVVLCSTCGIATNKLMKRDNASLRLERRKTWRRVIRPNNNKLVKHRGKMCRIKQVFWSMLLADCFLKKHKLTIRRKPFTHSLLTVFK